MGKPSHDRVKFFLYSHRVEVNRKKFHDLLSYAFDMDCSGHQFENMLRPHPQFGHEACGITIVCRPSQFARFLIKRNEVGFANGFKELHAELFIPEECPDFLDVSKRTHRDPRMGHGHGSQDEDCRL